MKKPKMAKHTPQFNSNMGGVKSSGGRVGGSKPRLAKKAKAY